MQQLIGVDLGGTSVRAARMNTEGHVFQYHSVATAATAGPEVVISQIVSLVEQVMSDANRTEILGIGVGSPGPLDPFEGIVLQAPNLRGWVNVPLRNILQELIGLPVVIGNDGNAAALGEWYWGSGQGCSDFIYVGLGTGIGGGIIANGQLLLGRKGMAGEIGHMQIEADGPMCSCGQSGCWEVFASGIGLARFAAQALQAGRPSLLHESAAKGLVTAVEIFAAAAQGDSLAKDLLKDEGEYLGRGLANLIHIFSPERIALGGGLATGMVWLDPHIRRVVAARVMPPFKDVTIESAHHGERVGVIGAAALMLASAVR